MELRRTLCMHCPVRPLCTTAVLYTYVHEDILSRVGVCQRMAHPFINLYTFRHAFVNVNVYVHMFASLCLHQQKPQIYIFVKIPTIYVFLFIYRYSSDTVSLAAASPSCPTRPSRARSPQSYARAPNAHIHISVHAIATDAPGSQPANKPTNRPASLLVMLGSHEIRFSKKCICWQAHCRMKRLRLASLQVRPREARAKLAPGELGRGEHAP